MNAVIWFRCNEIHKPILEINDKEYEVYIGFIPYQGEHITIHRENDGTLIRNYYMPSKPPEEYDRDILYIAREIEHWKKWEKHDKYVFNALPLVRISNQNGFYLLSRRIDLSMEIKELLTITDLNLTIDVSIPQFMLGLFLSTPENPCDIGMKKVTTILGDICFDISTPTNCK